MDNKLREKTEGGPIMKGVRNDKNQNDRASGSGFVSDNQIIQRDLMSAAVGAAMIELLLGWREPRVFREIADARD